MANLIDIVDDLRIDFPGAPEDVLMDRYRDVARRVCNKSYLLSQEIETFTWAGLGEYTPQAIANGEIFDAAVVRFKEAEITKLTRAQATHMGETVTGTPKGYYISPTGNLVLVPYPTTDHSSFLDGEFFWRPTLTATTIDDYLVNEYSEQLRMGVVARMLSMVNRPWTDYAGAREFRFNFETWLDTVDGIGLDKRMRGVPRKVVYGGL